MKHLLIALVLGGCASNPTSGNTIVATWSFKDVATGTTTGCPTGFTTAEVISQEIDSLGNNVGAQVVDPFSCAAGQGKTRGLPEGVYDVFVRITDGGANTFATSLLNSVDITITDGSIPEQVILNDGGYFHLSWTLVGATSGHTLTCAQANSPGSIAVLGTLNGTQMVFDNSFNCADGDGLTDGVVHGTYDLSIKAETTGSALGTPTALTKDIQVANQVTELGTITVNIDGL